ncbi:MAG TPA: ABC transporter ATP-binding protein [Vicinamibacterales bacterium]|jgi:lipopolysaccharide transport system ATP-binding protein
MPAPAVVFDRVSKKFRRGKRHDSLRDLIPATVARVLRGRPQSAALSEREFWAVRDVSFDVRAGEAVGIIGPNGAGKSTILKLLTRILKPTQGRCEIRGRAGALIEVAAGFHQDLTGRENVFLQGAIMGMKRAAITRRFDEIVEFAGVAEFIDMPVKRYSSGMNARLGFAIAAHLDPDVLLIDEVLSVGDAAFQDKCVVRMRELIRRGIPLVFISHNLPAILELCTRTIVIDRGAVQFDGSPAEAIQHYRFAPSVRAADARTPQAAIRLVHVELLNDRGQPSSVFHTNSPMRVRVRYHADAPVRNVSFAVDLHRSDGVYCAGINTMMDSRDLGELDGPGEVELCLPQLNLLPNYYLTTVGIIHTLDGTTLDLHSNVCAFSMVSERRDLGVMYLEHSWRHQPDAGASRTPLRHAASTGARR